MRYYHQIYSISTISIFKYFSQLIDLCNKATNSPYESKDLLKARGYRWSMNQNDKHRAWSIELTEDKVAEEINYLRSNVYGRSSINIPVEIFDAYSRFSSNSRELQNAAKYQDKLEWAKMLCVK
jgi:hypothetical protein